MTGEPLILLVEDREDDILLIRKSFAKGAIYNPLQVVRDGEEAICYLAGDGRYANRAEYPLPDLVLLDLKMPRVDGFEVLQWIRRQPGFSSIRVIVLTSSDAIRDVNRAYRLGANSFMVKQLDFENVVEMSAMLKRYWLGMDKAPDASRPEKEPSRKAQGP
jgi:CheY-like chemotaxis protein